MATRSLHGAGDNGFTSLPSGAKVQKTHPRLRYYAALDELNCRLGLVRAQGGRELGRELCALLERFQRTTILAADADNAAAAAKLRLELRRLDAKTAALEKKLPPLKNFLTPGDTISQALLHSARSACRQCELKAWAQPGFGVAAAYLNRLSSCLFALARLAGGK